MITVELEYRPFAFIPLVRRVEKRLPSRWSEMKPDQIIAIPSLQRDLLDDRKILQIFLGIKRSIAKRIDNYQILHILRNLKYIREPEPLGSFVIKKIMGFNAPDDNLKGITFGAFIFADTYYQNYLGGKREDLARFIACLYTDRKGFNEKLIERHAKIIRGAGFTTCEAIAINYALVREWLARAYPYVFQKVEQGKADKSKGWVGIFDMLVENDLGNQDKYAQLPVSTVLRYLNNRTKNYYKNGG